MNKREQETMDCPFCGSNVKITGKHLECVRCYYRSGAWCDTYEESESAIRAHNAMCRRLDPARVLQSIGGYKGSIKAIADEDYTYAGQLAALDWAMVQIRAMKPRPVQ